MLKYYSENLCSETPCKACQPPRKQAKLMRTGKGATLQLPMRDGSASDLKWHASQSIKSNRSVGFDLLKKNPPTGYKNRQVPSQNYCLQAKAMKPSEINLTHHPLHPGRNQSEQITS